MKFLKLLTPFALTLALLSLCSCGPFGVIPLLGAAAGGGGGGGGGGGTLPPSELKLNTTSLPYAVNGVAYSETLQARGGKSPYMWTVTTGTLPSALGLNSTSGEISGTPSDTPGDYVFTVEVADSASHATTREFTLTLYDQLVITTSSPLPDGTQGDLYSYTVTATGGNGTYTWSNPTSDLPAWLSLDTATGELHSSTVGASGLYSFTIRVEDNAVPPQEDEFAFNLTVTSPGAPAIAIAVPSESALVRGSLVSVTGSATPVAPATLTNVEIRIDSGSWVSATDDSGDWTLWSYVWNSTSVSDGGHVIYARATDSNTLSATDFVNVTVDNTLPGPSTAAPPGGTYYTLQSVTLAATDNIDPTPSIWYTTDGSDPVSSGTRAQYSAAIGISANTTLRFYAIDAAGNEETPGVTENYTIMFDTIYVATTGNDLTGDGTIGNPFETIQKGLDTALTGTTVIVLNGTYTGTSNKNLDFSGKDIYLKSSGGATNCTIDCESSGRGFYFHSGETSAAVLEGFAITNGSASDGGGILVDGASPTITDCIIDNNDTTGGSGYGGGGISLRNGASPLIENCPITNNTGNDSGGGIACWTSSSPTIINCTITDNWATANGGGVFSSQSSPEIYNCLIADNTANFGSGGGGICCAASTMTIANCTIANNDTNNNDGGGMFIQTSTVSAINNILWGNTAPVNGQQIYLIDGASSLTLDCCCYPGTSNQVTGAGTITAANTVNDDPLFKDTGTGNYRLKPGTMCFDAGDSSAVTWSYDLDGSTRITGVHVDIGCYELVVLRVPAGYGTIQAAIDASVDGNVVLVADGTYTGAGNKDLDFGGRKIALRSENGPESTIIDCENSGRGFNFHQGETNDSVVEGFTVQNGSISDGATGGGAVYCDNSAPIIRSCMFKNNVVTNFHGGAVRCYQSTGVKIKDCIIEGNTADQVSGAIDLSSSSADISDCTIMNNTASTYGGGGVTCYYSDISMSNCVISNNSSAGTGGGVYIYVSSSSVLVNCQISNNSSGDNGGGIYLSNADSLVSDCTFSSNHSENNGGGIYIAVGSPKLTNCHISDNSTGSNGGGVCVRSNATPELTNCLIAGNTALVGAASGGGLDCELSFTNLNNCTITGNAAGYGGAIRTGATAGITFDNSILWGNSAYNLGNQIYINAGDTVNLNYCDYANGAGDVAGGGSITPSDCITSDPQFVNVAVRDYHLRDSSPCESTGSDLLVPPGITTDLDGRSRIQGAAVDRGCYEGGWLAVPGSYATIQSAIDASTDGDTVIVADGTYTGAGNKDLDFGGRAITLRSEYGPTSCIIDCQNSGRGVYFHSGEGDDSVVDGFTIINGYLDPGRGGGIHINNSSHPTIRNLIISNCTALGPVSNNDGMGGGIYIYGSSPIISHCVITYNTANTSDLGGMGGGICVLGVASRPVITNCRITNNSSNYIGGGISTSDAISTIDSCTVADNSSRWGGGLCSGNHATIVNNTIVWNNTASSAANEIYSHGMAGAFLMTNCDYDNQPGDLDAAGPVTPINCLNADPVFVDTPAGNYRLSDTSPCIDMGSNALVPSGVVTDLDDDQRIRDGNNPLDGTATVDIGCYEHRTWEDVSPGGSPAARTCHNSMAYDSARSVTVLFGGYDGATVSSETWEYNGSAWNNVSPGGTPGVNFPEPRYFHAMAYDSRRGVVVLFGGHNTSFSYGDTWEWNGTGWTEKAAGAVPKPNPRVNHAMVYDSARGVCVLFGGDVSGSWNTETWEWDGSDWSNVSPGGTPGLDFPAGRGYFAMAYDLKRGVTLLHGGWNGSHLGDTWQWDGSNWNKLSPAANPDNRHAHMMVYDSACDKMVIFGGNSSGGANSETWKWNENIWIEEQPADKPDPRAYLGMVYDSKRKVVVVFGGAGAGYFGDTWEY